MLNKINLVCLAFVALSVHFVGALEMIEMNDANKNELQLSLYKSLEGVQAAYKDNFEFQTVADVRRFLARCQYVTKAMSKSDDSAFNGLAKPIKAIMADPNISEACSVTDAELTADFDLIDTEMDAKTNVYLSKRLLNTLVELRELANGNPALKRVIQHVIDLKASELSNKLLQEASHDINMFFNQQHIAKGWFDIDVSYKKVCEIDLIEPICKLVRSSRRIVQAIAKDFDEFAEMIISNDETKINQYIEASEVPMDVLKNNCDSMINTKKYPLQPIDLIQNYVSANFISEQQVEEYMEKDMDLGSYYSLYNLCKLVK